MGFFSFFTTPTNRPQLKLRNTLSGELEVFEPLGKNVKMYNCGPTVYDRQHIGNLRAAVFADTLRRTLEAWGYSVEQVINLTDFGHLTSDADEGEDKMSAGLRREGMALTLENMRTLAEKYADQYFNDLGSLGVDKESIQFPRASDYIPQQIALIERLEKKGFAYRANDGVYFDTAKFQGYGKLGNTNLAGQQAGVRVEAAGKRSPQDFVLWKPDASVGWKSPWGLGFPGWHIECTAMIFELLGEQIDIHTGGIEHISVHHNNEIAQAEAATGKQPFVRYWLHNDHIAIDGKKISKSLGNTLYLSDLTDRGLSPMALRYWFFTAHYRSSSNATWQALEGADAALKRLSRAYAEMPEGKADANFLQKFYSTLAHDLDTPNALALVWEHIKTLNRATLDEVNKVFGLDLSAERPAQAVPEGIQQLLAAREAARKHKDFEKADEMRKEIESAGYELKDTPEGPEVKKK